MTEMPDTGSNHGDLMLSAILMIASIGYRAAGLDNGLDLISGSHCMASSLGKKASEAIQLPWANLPASLVDM